ncbi:hypothetical protein BCR39DRAFT_585617 [Naematelia encephala]|uniref:Uncharacterized protein n=1 Tax=Naematelia encephala TaxID=71784 RepID=A0A1Y2BIN3_9TREE|nr:hypothetical protein BCR39DRAFT_585617 [Naematelia encephala]
MRLVTCVARLPKTCQASSSVCRHARVTVIINQSRHASTRETSGHESSQDDGDFFASHLTEGMESSSSSSSRSSSSSSYANSGSGLSSTIFGPRLTDQSQPSRRRLADPVRLPESDDFFPQKLYSIDDEPVNPDDTIPEFKWHAEASEPDSESESKSRQFPSGTLLVKGLLEKHGFLNTQQIWKLGTAGFRPQITPAIQINPDGRIRMKKVSTMREGQRPWVPPPQPSLPEHPFQSVSFLKRTLLGALENSGLIHKATRDIPLETEEDFKAAVAQAVKQNRRAERKALIARLPVPTPKIPATTKEVYGWAMGPAPQRVPISEAGLQGLGEKELEERRQAQDLQERRERREAAQGSERPLEENPGNGGWGTPHAEDRQEDQEGWEGQERLSFEEQEGEGEQSTKKGRSKKPQTVLVPGPLPTEAAWTRAARIEEMYHRDKAREAQAVAKRQIARRAQLHLETQKAKEARRELLEAGMGEAMRKEAKRQEALAAIRRYAIATGEDVSEWLSELEGDLGEVPMHRLEHMGQGAKPRISRFGPGEENVVRWRK